MSYESMTWEDSPSTRTSIDAENLNNMIAGIDEAHERLTVAESELTDKVNYEELSGDKFNQATDINTLYSIYHLGEYYLVGNMSDTEQWRFGYSVGLEIRHKVNNAWQSWVLVANSAIVAEVITARSTYANLNARLAADFAKKMNFTDLGSQSGSVYNNYTDVGTIYRATVSGISTLFFTTNSNSQFRFRAENIEYRIYASGSWGAFKAFAKQSAVDGLADTTPKITVWDYSTSEDNDFTVPTSVTGKLGDIVVVSTGSGSGGKIFQLTRIVTSAGITSYFWEGIALTNTVKTLLLSKADYSAINAIFASDGKLLDVSRDSIYPSANANAVSVYIDKNVPTISKSTLLAYYPNLTTVYVDNDETDVTITGSGTLTFKFKGEFNTGQLLWVGTAKQLNSLESRIAALEAAAE